MEYKTNSNSKRNKKGWKGGSGNVRLVDDEDGMDVNAEVKANANVNVDSVPVEQEDCEEDLDDFFASLE